MVKANKRIIYKENFKKAYDYMDQAIINGNCGVLCGYHCCRKNDNHGEHLGMYLLPLEYEYMQEDAVTDFEIHSQLQHVFIMAGLN